MVIEETDKLFQSMAGILKSNCDKTLFRELINDIFAQFRQLGEDLKREGPGERTPGSL